MFLFVLVFLVHFFFDFSFKAGHVHLQGRLNRKFIIRRGEGCISELETLVSWISRSLLTPGCKTLKLKKIILYLLDFEKLTANQKSDKFAFNQWENREITYIHCVHPKSRDQADSEKKLKVPTVDIKINYS